MENTKNSMDFYTKHLLDLRIVNTPIEDQETIISLERNVDVASVETTDNTILAKLRKRCVAGEWKLEKVTVPAEPETQYDITSAVFVGPKKLVQFREKSRSGRVMTEEEKQAARDRLAAARARKMQTPTK